MKNYDYYLSLYTFAVDQYEDSFCEDKNGLSNEDSQNIQDCITELSRKNDFTYTEREIFELCIAILDFYDLLHSIDTSMMTDNAKTVLDNYFAV